MKSSNDFRKLFSNLKEQPQEVVPISICGKAPEWYGGIQYKKLAPKYGFFTEWKRNHDNAFYVERFNAEVLSKLDPNRVIQELYNLTGGKPFALICYERPEDFCHRHLVSEWLSASGYVCQEWRKDNV